MALPSDWRAGANTGSGAALPGPGTKPMPTTPLTTPTDPASKAATEALWKLMQDAPLPALAEVMIWLSRHHEVLEWAKAGRFNPTPGATP